MFLPPSAPDLFGSDWNSIPIERIRPLTLSGYQDNRGLPKGGSITQNHHRTVLHYVPTNKDGDGRRHTYIHWRHAPYGHAFLDGNIQLVAGAFSADPEKSKLSGEDLRLEKNRVYGDYRIMAEQEAACLSENGLTSSRISSNNLHFTVAKTFLEAESM